MAVGKRNLSTSAIQLPSKLIDSRLWLGKLLLLGNQMADARDRLTRKGAGKVGRYCAAPGCSEIVPHGRRWCDEHRVLGYREDAMARGSSYSRGYRAAHRERRASMLAARPLCVM